MKKLSAAVFAVVMLLSLSVFSSMALAQGENHANRVRDGICDNRNGYVDADGNGVCDNASERAVKKADNRQTGKGFADANEDGVCDYANANAQKRAENRQNGKGSSDADNNGVCDNRGEGCKRQCTKAQ